MTTKDWQAEVDAAALGKFPIVWMHGNDINHDARIGFDFGASWAREKAKEREAKLVEALEKIDSMERSRGYPTGMEWMTIVGEVRAALKAWRGEG